MKIVIDTNILLAVVLARPEKARLISLTAGHELVAPEVLPFEVGNALSALSKRGKLSESQALQALQLSQKIPVRLVDVDIGKALEIALAHKLYAYDAYFLSIAATRQLSLLTLDRVMQRVAAKIGISTLE